jgi:hypothetical protein
MNLEFQVFENSQRTGGLYEGQAKNSEFRVGSLTQGFDFVEPHRQGSKLVLLLLRTTG